MKELNRTYVNSLIINEKWKYIFDNIIIFNLLFVNININISDTWKILIFFLIKIVCFYLLKNYWNYKIELRD